MTFVSWVSEAIGLSPLLHFWSVSRRDWLLPSSFPRLPGQQIQQMGGTCGNSMCGKEEEAGIFYHFLFGQWLCHWLNLLCVVPSSGRYPWLLGSGGFPLPGPFSHRVARASCCLSTLGCLTVSCLLSQPFHHLCNQFLALNVLCYKNLKWFLFS